MTIQELQDALAQLVAADPDMAAAQVYYGEGFDIVGGGLPGALDGKVVLNLAPVKLDRVGGF